MKIWLLKTKIEEKEQKYTTKRFHASKNEAYNILETIQKHKQNYR